MPKTQKILQDVTDTIANIDAQKDSAALIASFKTGETPPADFSFSDTQDLLKKKLELKSGSSITQSADPDSFESISALAPKPGRKKAVDRIKSLDKEIVEVETQRQGLETLISASKDLQSPKQAQQELADQKADIEVKLNTLLLQKHKFHCHVAQLDGKPIPPTPALFGDGNPLSLKSVGILDAGLEAHNSLSKTSASSHDSGLAAVPLVASPVNQKLVAIYDFTGDAVANELTIVAGEKLDLICVKGDGWTECKKDDGQKGYVPS